MTRVTNFGIKRTYIQAALHDDHDEQEVPQDSHSLVKNKGTKNSAQDGEESQSHVAAGVGNEAEEPPKKKRKRIRKKKPRVKQDSDSRMGQGDEEKEGGGGGGNGEEGEGDRQVNEPSGSGENVGKDAAAPGDRKKGKSKKNLKSKKDRVGRVQGKGAQRLSASELRRQKRIDERNAETTCFACREKGHSAKDCPVTNDHGDGGSSRSVVGICYRCGSTRHNLARCKKPTNPDNPLPHASCFVCSGKGHLASSCPQNHEKGVYPNGGCCKVCGETTHLARDCQLRKNGGVESSTAVFGIGKEAGADEDDFHIFKRKTREVERDERREEKAKKMMNVKAGVHSGIVKSFGRTPTPIASRMGTKTPQAQTTKTVVYF